MSTATSIFAATGPSRLPDSCDACAHDPRPRSLREGLHASLERSGRDERHTFDRELVARVLHGDTAARCALAERLQVIPRLLAVMNSRLDRPLELHGLADVAQDTAVTAWRTLSTFRGDGSLETWLYGLTRFHLANARRKNARRLRRFENLDPVDVESDPNSWEENQADVDGHEALHGALARLPEDARRVLKMRHFDSLGFTEIAARLDVPVNTAKTRYHRALERLHRLLEAGDREPRASGGLSCSTTRVTKHS